MNFVPEVRLGRPLLCRRNRQIQDNTYLQTAGLPKVKLHIMAFCANCGSQVDGRFCPKCGAAIAGGAGPAAPPPSVPNPGARRLTAAAAPAGLTENVACALCYVLGLITGILFLVLAPYNQNR